jgi:2-C-methyl-D-erythritol 2,4-cyclodiphosphate synthase/2-C-methyl-D-erythritol 4-phosphate cytidylyltransferase
MKVCCILACAGKGVRAGFEKNKLLVEVDGITCLERTLKAIYNSGLVDEIVAVASKEDLNLVEQICAPYNAKVVVGGSTRTQSVRNGLSACSCDIVLIHDGARPFVSKDLIKRCIDGAVEHGGVIPVIPSRNTVVKVGENVTKEYLGKDEIFSVQTPQAFKTELIKKAFEQVGDKTFNDDGEIYKTFIGTLYTIKGESSNVKLTYPQDFDFSNKKDEYRFGVGFDCHKLVEGRKLILGGIEIPHDKGLLGHSDADVLTHAIMDAILSSCALRDIGYHFPDTDEKYKGANSIELLKQVLNIAKDNGYKVKSISASIMAEKPKLLKIIPTITQNLANVIGIAPEKIGITATTLEGLGFVGREEGICVHATATVKSV